MGEGHSCTRAEETPNSPKKRIRPRGVLAGGKAEMWCNIEARMGRRMLVHWEEEGQAVVAAVWNHATIVIVLGLSPNVGPC